MSSNAQSFATEVLHGFKAAGCHTDEEIREAGGPSTTTLTKLRKVAEGDGTMPPPRGDTLRKIDRAASWVSGSARALWATGTAPVPHRSPGMPSDQIRPSKPVRPSGFEGYVERLADRLLEVEERLDILEQELAIARARAELGPMVVADAEVITPPQG